MRNQEENFPNTNQSFDRADMEEVFRVYKNYAAEHTASILNAADDIPYSVNESRALACKIGLFSEHVMLFSEAIDRISSTISILLRIAEKEDMPDERRHLRYLIEANINLMGLFSWLDAFGPRTMIDQDSGEELKG